MRWKVMVFIIGMMEESIKDFGSKEKWVVKEFLSGVMGDSTKENFRRIKKMGIKNYKIKFIKI